MPGWRSCITIRSRFFTSLSFRLGLLQKLEEVVRNRLSHHAIIHLAETFADRTVPKTAIATPPFRIFTVQFSGLTHLLALNPVHLPAHLPRKGKVAILVP
ncbi:MAG: hypothetical protein B7X53_04045 [Hyphomonas sp. 34-62-18]|nr:MAG: hypothetical protein B7X53_04045 [Hyphomonas sp. 34-62-18]